MTVVKRNVCFISHTHLITVVVLCSLWYHLMGVGYSYSSQGVKHENEGDVLKGVHSALRVIINVYIYIGLSQK